MTFSEIEERPRHNSNLVDTLIYEIATDHYWHVVSITKELGDTVVINFCNIRGWELSLSFDSDSVYIQKHSYSWWSPKSEVGYSDPLLLHTINMAIESYKGWHEP